MKLAGMVPEDGQGTPNLGQSYTYPPLGMVHVGDYFQSQATVASCKVSWNSKTKPEEVIIIKDCGLSGTRCPRAHSDLLFFSCVEVPELPQSFADFMNYFFSSCGERLAGLTFTQTHSLLFPDLKSVFKIGCKVSLVQGFNSVDHSFMDHFLFQHLKTLCLTITNASLCGSLQVFQISQPFCKKLNMLYSFYIFPLFER